MDTVNIHDAKTNLSRLIRRIEAGETIALARRGEVVAELRPPAKARHDAGKRVLGWMKGRVKLQENFDEIDSELDREFERDFLESKIFPE